MLTHVEPAQTVLSWSGAHIAEMVMTHSILPAHVVLWLVDGSRLQEVCRNLRYVSLNISLIRPGPVAHTVKMVMTWIRAHTVVQMVITSGKCAGTSGTFPLIFLLLDLARQAQTILSFTGAHTAVQMVMTCSTLPAFVGL